MPQGVSQLVLPAVASGTSTAVQSAQNTTVSNTVMSTTSISTGITTVAGAQISSQQLLDQAGPPGFIDRVIFSDLAADLARTYEQQLLAGAGSGGEVLGIRGVTGVNAITYTTGSPAVVSTTSAASFWNRLVEGVNAINKNRFLPPTAILLSPSRYSWLLEALDSSNRPLFVPSNGGGQFNGLGLADEVGAEGRVGTIAGVPAYVDSVIATNYGASTNADECYILRAEDVWTWSGELRLQMFDAPHADTGGVLFRAWQYLASAVRYPKAISVISGTGMVVPSGL